MSDVTYKVTTVIQSRDLTNPPVEVAWYGGHAGSGDSLGQAIAAAVSAMAHDESMETGDLPDSMRYDTLKVTFERIITETEPECSGRLGGKHSVPYCHKNEGGCAFHYPSAALAAAVSGNAFADLPAGFHDSKRERDANTVGASTSTDPAPPEYPPMPDLCSPSRGCMVCDSLRAEAAEKEGES